MVSEQEKLGKCEINFFLYGFTYPRTKWGKIFTFLYGLPSMIIFGVSLMKVGGVLARKIDKLVKKIKCKSTKQSNARLLFIFILVIACVLLGK